MWLYRLRFLWAGLTFPVRSRLRSLKMMRQIEYLRGPPGDASGVTLMSDDDEERAAVVFCNGAWTGWVDKRFDAATLPEALDKAAEARWTVEQAEAIHEA